MLNDNAAQHTILFFFNSNTNTIMFPSRRRWRRPLHRLIQLEIRMKTWRGRSCGSQTHSNDRWWQNRYICFSSEKLCVCVLWCAVLCLYGVPAVIRNSTLLLLLSRLFVSCARFVLCFFCRRVHGRPRLSIFLFLRLRRTNERTDGQPFCDRCHCYWLRLWLLSLKCAIG